MLLALSLPQEIFTLKENHRLCERSSGKFFCFLLEVNLTMYFRMFDVIVVVHFN